MNETECTKLISDVGWTDARALVSLSVLAVINVLVIVGNCLVIAAVFWSHKLRSVTNFFIVSLAVADLLVGIAVLPFSATWEVFKVSRDYPGVYPLGLANWQMRGTLHRIHQPISLGWCLLN